MQDSSREEKARRIIQWSRDNRTWTGNYDFFEVAGLFEGPVTQMMVADPMGLPPILTTEEILQHIFRSHILLERICKAGWLSPIPDLEEPYFSRDAAYSALDRLLKGDKPSRLEDEPALKAGEPEIGAIQPKWIKAAQAAKLLGISVRTLYDYSERGLVPQPRMLGKHRSYSVDALTKFMEAPDSPNLTKADLSRILR